MNIAQYRTGLVQTSGDYLISATIGQRRNAIDNFNFWQKIGLIMYHTTTRHTKVLRTWAFYLHRSKRSDNATGT